MKLTTIFRRIRSKLSIKCRKICVSKYIRCETVLYTFLCKRELIELNYLVGTVTIQPGEAHFHQEAAIGVPL